MRERKLIDVLNGTRTDIALEVRRADSYLHNLEHGLAELSPEKALELIREARKHLANVTD